MMSVGENNLKVFISHYQDDSDIAGQVQRCLKEFRVDAYLDVLDKSLTGNGAALTAHLKAEMNRCTDLLVVMSSKTYQSGWVPFEIGMAAHKDLPTVTYLAQNVVLPEYLDFWPGIKYLEQLKFYVEERMLYERKMKMVNESRCYSGVFHMDSFPTTEGFYSDLKRRLRMGR